MVENIWVRILALLLFGISHVVAADDPFGSDWPAGEGRELTGGFCSACHSLAIVKQQRLSRDSWDEVLIWMVEEQGMPDLPEPQREQVLDYLSTHFGYEN